MCVSSRVLVWGGGRYAQTRFVALLAGSLLTPPPVGGDKGRRLFKGSYR